MKIIKQYSLLLGVILLATACSKDETLQPTDLPLMYALPQGNQDFDNDIVALRDKYSSFFLYKYSKSDFYYSQVLGGLGQKPSMEAYLTDSTDPAFVRPTFQFIQKNWLSYYPDEFLKEFLPFRVLMVNNLRRKEGTPKVATITGWNHFAISYFSPEFAGLTPVRQKNFRDSIHLELWNYNLYNKKVVLPAGFTSVSNYLQTGVTAANMYTFGFLETRTATTEFRPQYDMMSYLRAIIGKTKAELDATILSPAVDTKGLVKRKYEALIKFYKDNYGLDLQEIGNTPVIL